jgi:hypothetical protein
LWWLVEISRNPLFENQRAFIDLSAGKSSKNPHISTTSFAPFPFCDWTDLNMSDAIMRPKAIGHHSMENLVPRLVGKSEATRLGVLEGWYGAKVSGTFVIGPCTSLATCIEAIDLLPAPAKIVDTGPAMKPRLATPFPRIASLQARTAYQISRKPAD